MRRATALLLIATTGCAPYSARVSGMRAYLDAGDVPRALEALDRSIGSTARAPEASGLDGDRALLRLERATLLAEVGRFADSAEELVFADRHLDVADMLGAERELRSRGLGADATGCLQGSPSCPYRTTPTEKLMINGMAALVYLGMHRAEDAAVEARRVDVSRRFLEDRNALPPATESLASFVADLARAARSSADVAEDAGEDVVVVVGYGRGPYRTPERVSVRSLAPRLAGTRLGPAAEQSNQTVWMSRIVEAPSPPPVTVDLDGATVMPSGQWDVANEASREWHALDAARLASRVAPVLDCEAAHPSWICGFPPDTRSWETLPARFLAVRAHVGAGRHRLVVGQNGQRRVVDWTGDGRGWRVLPIFLGG